MAAQKLGDLQGRYNRLSLPKLEGYSRVPGKAGRYRDRSGKTISNRDYKTRQREQYSGARFTLETYRDLRRESGLTETSLNQYQRFQASYAAKHKRNTISEVRKESQFTTEWKAWQRIRHRKGHQKALERGILLRRVGMLKRIAGKWVYVSPA